MKSPTLTQKQREVVGALEGVGAFDDPPGSDVRLRSWTSRDHFRRACADAVLHLWDARQHKGRFGTATFARISRLAKQPEDPRDPFNRIVAEARRQVRAWEVYRRRGPGKSKWPWEVDQLILEVVGLFELCTERRHPPRERLFDYTLPRFLKVADLGRRPMEGDAMRRRFYRAGGTRRALGLMVAAIRPDLGFPASEYSRLTTEWIGETPLPK